MTIKLSLPRLYGAALHVSSHIIGAIARDRFPYDVNQQLNIQTITDYIAVRPFSSSIMSTDGGDIIKRGTPTFAGLTARRL